MGNSLGFGMPHTYTHTHTREHAYKQTYIQEKFVYYATRKGNIYGSEYIMII